MVFYIQFSASGNLVAIVNSPDAMAAPDIQGTDKKFQVESGEGITFYARFDEETGSIIPRVYSEEEGAFVDDDATSPIAVPAEKITVNSQVQV